MSEFVAAVVCAIINGLKVETRTKQVEVDEGMRTTSRTISKEAAEHIQRIISVPDSAVEVAWLACGTANTGATIPNIIAAVNRTYIFILFVSLKNTLNILTYFTMF